MKHLVRYFRAFLLITALFGTAFAQTNDGEVIRVETQLVEVPFSVTDRAGRPILDIKRTNIVVLEDGKRQELAEFGATSAPFEVALLLDTSGSTRSDLALIKNAAAAFVGALRPGDRVAVISYRTERTEKESFAVSEIVQPLTDDRAKLKAALERVQTSNGTPLYDSYLEIARRVFGESPAGEFRGRRALVALTDGVDSVSVAEFDEVRDAFGESGISNYFIQVNTREFFEENLLLPCESAIRFSTAQIRRYYRVYYPKSNVEKTFNFCGLGEFEKLAISKGLYELADAQMKTLARISGGRVLPVADLSEARTAFKSVADDIGTRYSLGYYPSNEKRDGTLRKITVEIKGLPAGAVVRARESYTAPK